MTFDIHHHILHQSDAEITFEIDTKTYPLEAIYQTAYVFTRDSYIILDGNPEEKMKVSLCFKNPKQLEEKNLAGSFMNELLNQTIRISVSKASQKQKEAILSHALSVNLNTDES